MARAKNKDKILTAATQLFNEQGFVNVRLQHISDETIISLGNIAYHFKNKEAIVGAIFESWERKQREALAEYRHAPIFDNLDRIFQTAATLQQEYRFFYTDILEIRRAFPALFERISQLFHWQFLHFQEILRFNVSRGALQSLSAQQLDFLAQLLVEQLNTWPYTQMVWGQQRPRHPLGQQLWPLLEPYLTPAGQEELRILQEQTVTWEEES